MPADFARKPLSRRRFAEVAGAVSLTAGALALPSPAGATPAPVTLTAEQNRMVLQIAQAGAVFPVPFGDFGETGPAINRATAPRLQAATARLTGSRPAAVAAGAAAVVAAGLLDVGRPDLLTGLGKLASSSDADTLPPLLAVTALAVSTVSTHFDPNSDSSALTWLGGLRILYQRGRLPGAATRGNR